MWINRKVVMESTKYCKELLENYNRNYRTIERNEYVTICFKFLHYFVVDSTIIVLLIHIFYYQIIYIDSTSFSWNQCKSWNDNKKCGLTEN